jgi:transcriptional regulator with XRE-family HTH domain
MAKPANEWKSTTFKVIQEFLDKTGMSQLKFAESLNVSNSTFHNWKNGRTAPNEETQEKIVALMKGGKTKKKTKKKAKAKGAPKPTKKKKTAKKVKGKKVSETTLADIRKASGKPTRGKPGPKPGAKLKKDGTPRKKPGPKPKKADAAKTKKAPAKKKKTTTKKVAKKTAAKKTAAKKTAKKRGPKPGSRRKKKAAAILNGERNGHQWPELIVQDYLSNNRLGENLDGLQETLAAVKEALV